MNTAINLLSVIPMRKEPAHRSEMVSQLLFGEYVEVLAQEESFWKVKCLYDGYGGWVQANQLTIAGETLSTEIYTSDWSQQVSVNGKITHVSMGTPVYVQGKDGISLGAKAQVKYLPGDAEYWNSTEKRFTKNNLQTIYQKFLDTPYLWGGKSVFGIDCSGFVQQVFKMFGIKLLRDAYLQAEQGVFVENRGEAALGDLAFFNNEHGRIVHVGILLDDNQIVHASGKVRIDTLDKEGIVNVETGKRTHQLHSIKRVK